MPSVMTRRNIKSTRIDSGEMSWESLMNAAIRLLVAYGDRLRAEAAQVDESIPPEQPGVGWCEHGAHHDLVECLAID